MVLSFECTRDEGVLVGHVAMAEQPDEASGMENGTHEDVEETEEEVDLESVLDEEDDAEEQAEEDSSFSLEHSYSGVEREKLDDIPENKPWFWTKKLRRQRLVKIRWWPWPRDPRDDPDAVFYGRSSREYRVDNTELTGSASLDSRHSFSSQMSQHGPAQAKEEEQFDPLDKPVFWWWFPKWVLTGEGYHKFIDQQENYRFLADRFGWELPPPQYKDGPALAIAFYRQKIIGQGKWMYKRRFNIQTMFHYLGVAWLLEQVRSYAYETDKKGRRKHPYLGNVLYGFIVSLVGVLFPSIITIVLYGLIPLQGVTDCAFKDQAVFLLFTNPVSYVILGFTQITLFIGCIDERLPWRPFRKYAPILLAVYVMQVVISLPIVLTVGYYTMQGIVALAINTIVVCIGIRLRLKALVDYGTKHYPNIREPKREEDIKHGNFKMSGVVKKGKPRNEDAIFKEVHRKARVYYKILITQTITYFVYFGWIFAYKESGRVGQTALAVAQFVVETASRKILQHMTSRKWTGGGMYQVDVSFLICAAWVYSAHGVFVAFATPNFKANAAAFIAIFVEQLGANVFIAMLHQSQLWFRFRSWIKIWPRTFVRGIRRQDPEVIPIYEEMDLDGRGCTNAHGDYRRAKIRFDIFKFLGIVTGYTCYVANTVVMRYGPNKEFFPFNSDSGPNILDKSSLPFSDEDYFVSLYFAAGIVVSSLLGIIWTSFYINKLYPFIGIYWQEMNQTFHKVPEYLGFYLMIITSNVMLGVMVFLIHNRVWYADIGDTTGSCRA